jgi:hypothetical protein
MRRLIPCRRLKSDADMIEIDERVAPLSDRSVQITSTPKVELGLWNCAGVRESLE